MTLRLKASEHLVLTPWLNLAEPSVGDIELRTTFGLYDLPAVFFRLGAWNPRCLRIALSSAPGCN